MTAAAFPRRVVSGGQTGVDRAALDVALELGFPCGGWVPAGRRAEDGHLPPHYPLRETPTSKYPERTRWNVRDSDATLIVTAGPLTGGTALTSAIAAELGRPQFVVDLNGATDTTAVRAWLTESNTETLNVAGPRESTIPGIYARARTWLRTLLQTPSGA
jgi:predicted Rossmann fold nucleotide-binding protein DprA/Smf involved in DNA uptake